MNLYLVRHGPVCNPPGIVYGRTDVSLAVPAQLTAERLRRYLPHSATVMSSPLKRCSALAHSLYPHQPVVITAALQELDFGLWEGQPWPSPGDAAFDAWCNDYYDLAPPEGESFFEMLCRVGVLINQQDRALKDVVWVTHAGVIRSTLHLLGGISVRDVFKFPLAFGSVTAWRVGTEWHLTQWNRQ